MFTHCPWASSCLPLSMERFDARTDTFKWFKPNWYLPVHLGGYGIDPRWSDGSLRITRNQRILAAMFVHNPDLALFRITGLPYKASKEARTIVRPRPVFGSYVARDGEVEVSELLDKWGERMMSINRAMLHDTTKFPNFDLATELILSTMARDRRLHPMSAEGIVNHWELRYFAYTPMECPPLSYIKHTAVGLFSALSRLD